jgi:uncharacterized protein (DUF697 family)
MSANGSEAEFGAAFPAQEGNPELQQLRAELNELGTDFESPLSEVEEMELAGELLEVTTEEELEQFLGRLIKGVSRRVGGFLPSGVGKAIGGVLKNVARAALPVVGGAIGSFVAPGLGTAIGSRLGGMAANLFEEELEQLYPEDRDFEVARRVVRLSAAAARNGALAPGRRRPRATGRAAVFAAARRYAPGVYRRFPYFARRPARWYWPQPIPAYYPAPVDTGGDEPYPAEPQPGPAAGEPVEPADTEPGELTTPPPRAASGRWVRRGRKVIVFGA